MYSLQIKILEQKINQLLSNKPLSKDQTIEVVNLQNEVKMLHRLEWDETYETVKIEDDR
jgi:hypothetical protein